MNISKPSTSSSIKVMSCEPLNSMPPDVFKGGSKTGAGRVFTALGMRTGSKGSDGKVIAGSMDSPLTVVAVLPSIIR